MKDGGEDFSKPLLLEISHYIHVLLLLIFKPQGFLWWFWIMDFPPLSHIERILCSFSWHFWCHLYEVRNRLTQCMMVEVKILMVSGEGLDIDFQRPKGTFSRSILYLELCRANMGSVSVKIHGAVYLRFMYFIGCKLYTLNKRRKKSKVMSLELQCLHAIFLHVYTIHMIIYVPDLHCLICPLYTCTYFFQGAKIWEG